MVFHSVFAVYVEIRVNYVWWVKIPSGARILPSSQSTMMLNIFRVFLAKTTKNV